LIVTFEGQPRELRELLRETFNPPIVRPIGPVAGGTLEDFATELPDVDVYADDLAHKIGLAELERQRATLAAEVDVLEARASAARPLVEAEAVIAKAAELWKLVDAAVRAFETALGVQKISVLPVRTQYSELFRSVKVLGDQLGEEGGEEEESPATATLKDA
jgi:hypothetical protein